tara:strand:- start:2337 stop:3470 length:1134 start_codon:yes stop_codon:yes gene_type:complete
MKPVADLHARFSQKDVDDVEKFADRILKKYDIDIEFTRHFVDRLNDPRNNPEIKVAELQRFFKKIQKNKGRNIRSNPDVELVLKDMSSNLNLPVVINKRGDSFEVVNKTIMRKQDFKTTSKVVRYEEKSNPRIPRKKGQPAGSDKHSDLYTDENPKGTIHGLGFKDVETARASVKKIEGSGKSHAHKIQAAIAMEQRARVMGKTKEAAVYRAYIEKMKKITKQRKMKESVYNSKCPPGYKYDKKLRSCVPKSGFVYAYPFFGRSSDTSNQSGQNAQGSNGQNGNDQTGNGNGNGAGNGNGNGAGAGGNGQNTGETYLAADVRKMPDGGYGVYADKFVKGKRVTLPSGKHAKELKKVYKNEKDANDYMAAIMIAKGGG